MEKFDRRQYNIDKQRQQREAAARLSKIEQDIEDLYRICNDQQDEIVALKATAMAYDGLLEDYEALEAKNKEQESIIEELKARLGVD